MKVAIVAFSPMGRGSHKWGWVLAQEWGADYWVDPVPGKDHSYLYEDVTYHALGKLARKRHEKLERAVDELDTYDLVIVSEIYKTKKEQCFGYDVLEQLSAPWTMMIHGAPEAGRRRNLPSGLWDSAGWMGKLLTNSENAGQAFSDRYGSVEELVVLPHLPYVRQATSLAPIGSKIISTSALQSSKGITELSMAAVNIGRDVRLHGSPSYGNYGYGSSAIHNRLVKLLGLNVEDQKPFDNSLWKLEYNGAEIDYVGAYDENDLYDVMSHASLNVDLAHATWCTGHLEYVSLEAMDFGVPILVPSNHMLDMQAPYELFTVDDYISPRKYNEESVQHIMTEAANLPVDERMDIAMHNIQILEQYHSPAAYIEEIKRGMGFNAPT